MREYPLGPQVDLKLQFVQDYLQLSERASGTQLQALREAATIQLAETIKLYLKELAVQFHVPSETVDTPLALKALADSRQIVAAEIDELVLLFATPGQWLYDLHVWHQQCLSPLQSKANVIASSTSVSSECDLEKLSTCLSKAKEMIVRHRMLLQEQ